jgi:hypothetical protein
LSDVNSFGPSLGSKILYNIFSTIIHSFAQSLQLHPFFYLPILHPNPQPWEKIKGPTFIHVALPFFMVIKQMMTSILALHQFVINKQCVVLVLMFFLVMGKGLRHKICEAMNNQGGFFGLFFKENVLRTYEGKFNYFQVFIYVEC